MKAVKKADAAAITARIFTYDQVVRISDENYEVLNRSIDPSKLKKDDTFVFAPMLIHHYAFMEPIEPHLRVMVSSMKYPSQGVGLQDLTFEQFEQGKEIINNQNIKK